MTGTHLEIVSHNVLWYKHSFRMDCISRPTDYLKTVISLLIIILNWKL